VEGWATGLTVGCWQVIKSTGWDWSSGVVYLLCTGFTLILMKAVGIWDNILDNFYQLVSHAPAVSRVAQP
jgi:hypothetical protein